MIPKKYDVNRNNDTYHISTKQYLTSRNKTFSQNQYHYIRQGDESAIPGTVAASSNTYAAQGHAGRGASKIVQTDRDLG